MALERRAVHEEAIFEALAADLASQGKDAAV
jgi:hypothetical protein